MRPPGVKLKDCPDRCGSTGETVRVWCGFCLHYLWQCDACGRRFRRERKFMDQIKEES